MLPQKAQPDDVCGHACQSKSSLMIVVDIFSCRQMKRMRKWLSKAMPKYQHRPQTMNAQTAVNSSRRCRTFKSCHLSWILNFFQRHRRSHAAASAVESPARRRVRAQVAEDLEPAVAVKPGSVRPQCPICGLDYASNSNLSVSVCSSIKF